MPSGIRAAITWLLPAVVVAGALDAATTLFGLHTGAREGNPLAAAAFSRFGVTATLVGRVVLPTVVFGVALCWAARRNPAQFGAVAGAVGFATLLWVAIAAQNLVRIAHTG